MLKKKDIGPHNIDILSIFIGWLIGDGNCERSKEYGTRITISQSSRNKEYLYWIHKYLAERGYCSTDIPKMGKNIGKKNKIIYNYKLQTYTYTSLNYLQDIFYKNGKKVIPFNIEELLTPLALAVWIQDKGIKTSSGIIISIKLYTFQEIENFIKKINKKYNIDSYIRDNESQYIIYIPKKSMKKLSSIIKPYMVESMYNKISQ